jgi:hypothetical protein
MLLLQNGDVFATGMVTYAYNPATDLDTTSSIFYGDYDNGIC